METSDKSRIAFLCGNMDYTLSLEYKSYIYPNISNFYIPHYTPPPPILWKCQFHSLMLQPTQVKDQENLPKINQTKGFYRSILNHQLTPTSINLEMAFRCPFATANARGAGWLGYTRKYQLSDWRPHKTS